MLKLSLAAGSIGLMALALPMQAHAQYAYPYSEPGVRNVQCERERSDDSAAGTIVGALAGALIGGAIGNNIENDREYTRYNRRGRPVETYREGRSESGNVAVGAVLGALVGGVAGNSIAKDTGPDCQVAYAPYSYSSTPSGAIPRTTQGLYGGPEVMGQGGYQTGYPASYPPTPSYPDYRDEPRYEAPDRDCRVIHRETRLPDGDVQRDPVTACYDERSREWRIQDGYTDDPYGY
ncbi:MAG: hypothetical protein GC196_13730 [Hyphomonas sp.]|jgi:hypothetical protein|uniref:glycine zipper domain-containing protein n=1 Tax=Hyphomonas sp. TaxID=87 RepID=UPI0037C11219|nr:hypothetical protein [Hyphomonas sp.]